MIPLYENYKDYQAPRFVCGTMVSLISWLPEQYVSGLRSVVLTNSKALGKGKTRRVGGRKHKLNTCLGFYHPQSTREAPWIEIVVDNIIARMPPVLRWLPFVRKLEFASTLFHEVGHHLDYTIGAPARSGEELLGRLAVIGPTRMNYARVIPLVDLTAREISRALSGKADP